MCKYALNFDYITINFIICKFMLVKRDKFGGCGEVKPSIAISVNADLIANPLNGEY